ncbi:DUF4142 domain-containing protein [Silvibacterium dinghuense]|nr:DUF4142 domain-containing protein [Silvibacterium dinghuense]GGG91307.1 hypothetical protein GCM10011586_02350 [Silvibacterium dinghuense]
MRQSGNKGNRIENYAGITMLAAGLLFGGSSLFAQASVSGTQNSPSQNQPQSTTMAPGANANAMNTATGDNGAGAMQDKDFVETALQGGMAEVQLGQLAAQKGSSGDVRQFGQRMVADHTKLGDAMKTVATQLGVKPPKEPSKKDRELMEKLQGLSGQQFDDAYIAAMVKDHKKDNQDFQLEAQQAQNPALKQLAAQGDQMIQQHLAMIEQIGKAHNVVNDKGKVVNGE